MTDAVIHPDTSSARRPFVPPAPTQATLGQSLGRGLAILRYHRPSQLWNRAAKLVRRRAGWERSPADSPADWGDAQVREAASPTFATIRARRLAAWRHRLEDWTTNLATRTFRYLNHSHRFADRIDWQIGKEHGVSDLWRFHLHYQDELLAAVAEGEDSGERRAAAWRLMEEWIEGNPRGEGRGDAWHPFCISRRIINWMIAWDVIAPPGGDASRQRMLHSLAAQGAHLADNLEWDLRGNHLLVNLHALGLAAAFLEGVTGQRTLEVIEEHLPGQLHEQLLPSGEHFERSPMYHAQMLEAVLDLGDALAVIAPDLAAQCRQAAGRMADLLAAIRHPDGQIPLLGDSVFDDTPAADPLLKHTRTDSPHSSSEAGGAARVGDYWIARDAENFLLFDTGPVGADELPAHAHCDLLSFEASFRGERVFVDAGVFDYEDAPLRRYGRSTAAHNVVQVDGCEQCDTWSRFRMGRRGRPLRAESGRTADWDWCFASHDAYRGVGVPEASRWMAARPGGVWMAVETLHGTGEHDITLRWHLDPAIAATCDDGTAIRLSSTRGTLVLTPPGEGECWLEQYPFCPEFGRRHDAAVVVWRTRRLLSCRLLWSVRPAEIDFSAHIETSAGETSPTFVESLIAGQRSRIPLP